MGTHEDARAAMAVQRALATAACHCWYNFECDGELFHLLIPEALHEARGREIELGGKYSARIDGPHTPDGQKHLHLHVRGNQLFAINWDGSARHGSGVRIPNKVVKAIGKRFQDLKIPPNQLLEAEAALSWTVYLLEG